MKKSGHDYLSLLESESVYIIREAYAQFKNLAILFSGGKDSIVLTHLAMKAFYPHSMPISLLHIDTGHNFEETIRFRDDFVKKFQLQLKVGSVEESIKKGDVREEVGVGSSRNSLQSVTLLKTIEQHKIDALFGGGRRDEEKARSKERIFSHRNEFGEWDPKNQRPELWNLYNGKIAPNEHFRVFPLSNWTEYDIWSYIKKEEMTLPSLYFSHKRNVFTRKGALYGYEPYVSLKSDEVVEEKTIRFRTIGDVTCTCAIESYAATIDDVLEEILSLKTSERGLRADDKRSETAMEDRKRQGYF